MGHIWTVEALIKTEDGVPWESGGGYEYVEVHSGPEFGAAYDAALKAREDGSKCIRFVWRPSDD